MDPLLTCMHCPRLCHNVCPTVRSEHRETTSPTSLLTLLYLSRKGTTGAVPDPTSSQELLYALDHCILCARCTVTCELKMTPWEEIRKGRAEIRRKLRLPSPWNWEELWAPPPVRHPLGYGLEPWLIIGSLKGIEIGSLLKHLGSDRVREWFFPRRGIPLYLYLSWCLGYDAVFHAYKDELQAEITSGGFRGVAWSDPHEGKAIRALLEDLRYQGKRGYGPEVLGIVKGESVACHDLGQRYGCCGAGGGYPLVDPEHSQFLAENFPEVSRPIPGICREHLSRYGRTGFFTDWR